jgi:hypothetical protein
MATSLERVDFEEHQRETFKLNKMQFQLRYYWRIDDRTMEWATKQRYLPLINKRNSAFIESLLNSTVGLLYITRYYPGAKAKAHICDVNKRLRPTSLTPVLSNVDEDFAFEELVVVKEIDNNQFGTIPKSSTKQALISPGVVC